jgi:hypothetical protein
MMPAANVATRRPCGSTMVTRTGASAGSATSKATVPRDGFADATANAISRTGAGSAAASEAIGTSAIPP